MKKLKLRKSKFNKLKVELRNKPLLIPAFFVVILCVFSIYSGVSYLSFKISYGDMLNTGYTSEVKSVSFSSGTDEGDASVTKKADWVDKAVAQITLNLSSIAIPQYTNQDVILVLDTSLSMTEERVQSAQEAVKRFTEYLFSMGDNRVAFVTFATNSTIKTGFTNDPDIVNTFMETLDVGGSTNYYDALKDVEEVLDGYVQRENTELHMVFITDGYPTEMVEYHRPQFEKLKQEYPYLEADSIAFEFNNNNELNYISDYVYKASIQSLSNILYGIVINAEYYDTFYLTDYIDTTYFEFVEDSVEGLDYDTETGRITFDYSNYKTGTSRSVSFKVKVKDEYLDTYGYFPTNTQTNFVATVPSFDKEISASTTETPVLKSWYDVTYNSNTPANCDAIYDKVLKIWPFDKVYIDESDLTCPNTSFGGWEILTDDITMIGTNSFLMPKSNVNIGGTWKTFALGKRMEGTIYNRPKLYNYLADNAVASDSGTASDKGIYTLATTTSDTYPVQYYKGSASTSNNLLFGGYCWRIVRTTDTGGTMILFSGSPVDGVCNNTGKNLMVSSGKTSFVYDGFTSSSYVYGKRYGFDEKDFSSDGVFDLGGAKGNYSFEYVTSIKYATSYTLNADGQFELAGDIDTGTPSTAVGKYAISLSSTSATSSSYLYYIYKYNTWTYYYRLTVEDYEAANGEDLYSYYYKKAQQVTWYHANDVEYDSTNGVYKLVNTIEVKPAAYDSYLTAINGDTKYRYTCFSTEKECEAVNVVLRASSSSTKMLYLILNDGNNFEEAYDAVIENPTDVSDSNLKTKIEDWYANSSGLLSYQAYIEDANYCNNRTIIEKGFFDINATTYNSPKVGKNSENYTKCRSVDVVNVSNNKLKYPIFFLTYDEYGLVGGSYNNTYLNVDNDYAYWIVDWGPGGFTNGLMISSPLTYTSSVSGYMRPVVSLANNVYLAGGDGTPENPYTVDLG